METEEDEIETVTRNWGSDDSKDQLMELLGEGEYEGNIEDELCGGNCDAVSFYDVIDMTEDEKEFKATVLIDFEEVIHQQCKDANNRKKRTAQAIVTISKEYQLMEVSEVEADPQPHGDVY